MDKSQLQRLATQCGFTSGERSDPMFMECLRVFAKAVAAATREECAMVCSDVSLSEAAIKQHNTMSYINAANDCANAIRNMGKEGT